MSGAEKAGPQSQRRGLLEIVSAEWQQAASVDIPAEPASEEEWRVHHEVLGAAVALKALLEHYLQRISAGSKAQRHAQANNGGAAQVSSLLCLCSGPGELLAGDDVGLLMSMGRRASVSRA